MNEPKDFQIASAKHIVDLFNKGQNRVLLSDEVGLGKTTVAKTVVGFVRDEYRNKTSDKNACFKVVYVCSNLNIAKQNIGNLGIDTDGGFDIANSRLSMLHLSIYNDRINKQKDPTRKTEQIIPLTPATSLQLKNGQGMMGERALICYFLSRLPSFQNMDDEIWNWFQINAGDNSWIDFRDYYTTWMPNNPEYVDEISGKLTEKLSEDNYVDICDELYESIKNKDEYYDKKTILKKIRQLFAEISLDMLNPDLVIMDEFQRFKDLIHSDSSENQLLVNKFFGNPSTKVLLLSATPYKPYSTLEELNDDKEDHHYKDFMELMEFLFSTSVYKEFKQTWSKYKKALLSGDKDMLFTVKQEAEDMLFSVMSRTERFNSGILRDLSEEIEIDNKDIESYLEVQNQLAPIAENKKFPVEYVKSSPYILSFMDKYKIKTDYFEKHRKKVNIKQTNKLLIPFYRVNGYENIPYDSNARLKYLYGMFFGSSYSKSKSGVEFLLWVPASRPYYKVDENCVFSKQKNFSKAIIFSSWEMVPRMTSVMMSYYAERLTIGKIKDNQRHRVPSYFNTDDDEEKGKKLKGYGVSRLTQTGGSLLRKTCDYLAELYNPKSYLGMDIKQIRIDLIQKIKDKFSETDSLRSLKRSDSSGFESIEDVMSILDGESKYIESVPKNIEEILVDISVASPAICIYRCLSNYNEEDRKKIASELSGTIVSIFNRSIAAATIDLIYDNNQEYYENVLKYCVMGNLQAVLDEYYYLSGDHFVKNMQICEKRKSTRLSIDSKESFETGNHNDRMQMRTHFAISFASDVKTEEGVDRVTSIRTTFNSPFRPFVLTTTSVGQEGLDFHWYARKIIHWNLPSNPVDFEQREGRINRYNCLAIRRNVAHIFGDDVKSILWNDLFEKATQEFNGDKKYSEIVPHWCLPPEWKDRLPDEKREMIERIVPLYPFSRDKMSYERLIKVLSLYRLTLGQPRQEELLQLLSSYKLTEEEQRELLMDLCPYNKER